jgi:diketogulonate reductase-like aldo/keto reductase
MTVPEVSLHNGVKMPQLGLGVWQTEEGREVERAVEAALDCGYRLIDTAAAYGNEAGVGRAIAESGVPREDMFVTTKLWNDDHGYDKTLRAFDKSCQKLGLDYVDLYLIHWPVPQKNLYVETWQALEWLYQQDRVRAIGVSNFVPAHIEELQAKSGITPMVNQIELHPQFKQAETRAYCTANDIAVEAYSPLMHGGDILQNAVIQDLADKYEKTPGQIVLRWHIQQGLIAIPKSTKPHRIEENFQIFDFELSGEDFQRISALPEAGRQVGGDPETVGSS